MVIDGNEKIIVIGEKTYHCALDVTMDYIGGKWKVIVLWYLRKGSKRFSELRRMMPDITEKMLSIQLRKLEEDGIVSRKVHPLKPPQVEYALTDFGATLLPVLGVIADWGRHLGETQGKITDKT